MLIMFDMGDKIKNLFKPELLKPAEFLPAGAIPGTSKRLIAVNLIGIGRFV
jgi:hypothetical protein